MTGKGKGTVGPLHGKKKKGRTLPRLEKGKERGGWSVAGRIDYIQQMRI